MSGVGREGGLCPLATKAPAVTTCPWVGAENEITSSSKGILCHGPIGFERIEAMGPLLKILRSLKSDSYQEHYALVRRIAYLLQEKGWTTSAEYPISYIVHVKGYSCFRDGRLDLLAWKETSGDCHDYIGIEVDRTFPKRKSVEKLLAFKKRCPTAITVVVLRSKPKRKRRSIPHSEESTVDVIHRMQV
jgi:hypothetical protein